MIRWNSLLRKANEWAPVIPATSLNPWNNDSWNWHKDASTFHRGLAPPLSFTDNTSSSETSHLEKRQAKQKRAPTKKLPNLVKWTPHVPCNYNRLKTASKAYRALWKLTPLVPLNYNKPTEHTPYRVTRLVMLYFTHPPSRYIKPQPPWLRSTPHVLLGFLVSSRSSDSTFA